MVVWWLCQQFPPVHDFGKPRWGAAYVPCVTNLREIYAWVVRWHVTGMLSLAEHWQGRRALSNHVCAHSVISMWHVLFLQHLARACSEQSRSTAVLPNNHVIQMPQCLSGFVNHDYSLSHSPQQQQCFLRKVILVKVDTISSLFGSHQSISLSPHFQQIGLQQHGFHLERDCHSLSLYMLQFLTH